MKITNIKSQKGKSNRCNIDIDGSYYCGIDSSVIVDLDLYQGKEIDKEVINQICQREEYKKCLDRAYTIISIRMNSEAEIYRKLSEKFSKSAVSRVIRRLKELKYLDDKAFAESWVESRKSSRGRFRLKQELMQKKVNEEIIEQALSGCTEENEVESARNIVMKKHLSDLDRDIRSKKICSLLSSRGYSYSVIKKVLDE